MMKFGNSSQSLSENWVQIHPANKIWLQSFVISQMPCHGVIMRRLENRFSAAFWHQHLVVFLLCETHSIMLILSQYKVCVGQHCVRAHHATISSYHLVNG